MKAKQCATCGTALPSKARVDHRFCGVRCRVRAHRLRQAADTTAHEEIKQLQRELRDLKALNQRQADKITGLRQEIRALVEASGNAPVVPANIREAMRQVSDANKQLAAQTTRIAELELEKVQRLDQAADHRNEVRKAAEDAIKATEQKAQAALQEERRGWQGKLNEAVGKEQAALKAVAQLGEELRKRPKPGASSATVTTPPESPWRDALTDSVRQEEELWAKLQQRRKELGLPLLGRFMRGEAAAPEQAAVLAFRRRADRYYDGENEGDASIVWTEVRCRLDAVSERVLLDKSAAKIAGYQLKLEQLQRRP